jgi:hypothetical protein
MRISSSQLGIPRPGSQLSEGYIPRLSSGAASNVVSEGEEEEEVNTGSISTIAHNKFSPGELRVVKQVGGVEVLGLVLKSIISRNLATTLTRIRSEKTIQELNEDNQLLMADMNQLRDQNKELVDAFVTSSQNFLILEKKLDMMRTERVVRVLEKVREQLPAYEAFLILKIHTGFPLT